jgi:tellurite resistance protein
MDAKFLKIILLAAVSDGEIQGEELELLNQVKKSHPELKKIPDEVARMAMADIYNKFSAGMETKYILEQLGSEFNKQEKESAFAMAMEVCAADYNILPAESDFLQLLVVIWAIPDDVVNVVKESIKLRYSI